MTFVNSFACSSLRAALAQGVVLLVGVSSSPAFAQNHGHDHSGDAVEPAKGPTKPGSGSSDPFALDYRSAFSNYRRYDEQMVGWREANDTAARIGGWKAYAREAQQPDAPLPGSPQVEQQDQRQRDQPSGLRSEPPDHRHGGSK